MSILSSVMNKAFGRLGYHGRFQITFLGTAGAQPTKFRNVSGVMLKLANEQILIDCGDGIQQQIMRYGEKLLVDRIFITHWHGDHYFGIFGLISTMNLNNRISTLFIYGPCGLLDLARQIKKLCHVTFEIVYVLLRPNDLIKFKGWTLKTYRGDHSIENLVYSFKIDDYRKLNISKLVTKKIPPGPHFKMLKQGKSVEFNGEVLDSNDYLNAMVKGKKVVFSGDTRPIYCAEIYENCGILVHECMYLNDLDLPLAKSRMHTIYSELLQLKQTYDISHIICTHFSAKCTRFPKNQQGIMFARDGLIIDYF